MGGEKIQAKMSNSTGADTPLQEAVSIISITSILASVGCYVAALNRIPVITQGLHWVADRVYEFLPAFARLPGAQVPILAASAVVGIVFFLFTIPFSYWLAGVFARAGYVSMERQTTQLKRFREWKSETAVVVDATLILPDGDAGQIFTDRYAKRQSYIKSEFVILLINVGEAEF
jgi:hypothetical protein